MHHVEAGLTVEGRWLMFAGSPHRAACRLRVPSPRWGPRLSLAVASRERMEFSQLFEARTRCCFLPALLMSRIPKAEVEMHWPMVRSQLLSPLQDRRAQRQWVQPGPCSLRVLESDLWDSWYHLLTLALHLKFSLLNWKLNFLVDQEKELFFSIHHAKNVHPHKRGHSQKDRQWKFCWGYGETGTLLCCWWECKIVLPFWKTIRQFFKKLNPATALLGICPRELEENSHV